MEHRLDGTSEVPGPGGAREVRRLGWRPPQVPFLRLALLFVVAIATGVGILSVGHGPASEAVDPASQFGGASPGTITFFYPSSSLPPGRTSSAPARRRVAGDAGSFSLLAALIAGRLAFDAALARRGADRDEDLRVRRVLDLVPARRGPPAHA